MLPVHCCSVAPVEDRFAWLITITITIPTITTIISNIIILTFQNLHNILFSWDKTGQVFILEALQALAGFLATNWSSMENFSSLETFQACCIHSRFYMCMACWQMSVTSIPDNKPRLRPLIPHLHENLKKR